MRISAHDYIFSCRSLDAAGAIPLLIEAGIHGVEVMVQDLRGDHLLSLRKTLVGSDMKLIGFSHNVNCDDEASIEKAVAEIQEVLPQAAELGGSHLGLSVLSAQPNPHPPELRQKQAEAVLRIAAAAKRHGVRVNLHTYAPDGEDQFRRVRELAELLDESILDLGPDLNWLIRGGADPVEFLKHSGKRVRFCHLRDEQDGVWTDALGDGDFPLIAVLSAMKEYCDVQECVIELALPPERVKEVDLVEIHRRSLQALQAAMQQVSIR